MAKKAKTKSRRSGKKSEPLGVDHRQDLKRVHRLLGQVEGVGRMIEQHRYCPEILQQIKAARSALRGLELSITERHLRHCVRQSFASRDAFAANRKIEEIVQLLK